jgi:tRNA A-37 threonylcarbamoyl transferase component Bud32
MPRSYTAELGTALAGRYLIEEHLGKGGMATVYKARDLKHERSVALKVLNPELGVMLGAERFLTEIKVTATLQHPNLLTLIDSGEANGLLYYVMPLLEGETLRARMTREGQLPVAEAVRITVGIGQALAYAHARGIIHRDLKPENIMLQFGQPIVVDFGVALAMRNAGGARMTQTGMSIGTPQYMSPEQASGDKQIDARADQFALATVLYEMLVGEAPHRAPTAQGVIARHDHRGAARDALAPRCAGADGRCRCPRAAARSGGTISLSGRFRGGALRSRRIGFCRPSDRRVAKRASGAVVVRAAGALVGHAGCQCCRGRPAGFLAGWVARG